MSTPLPFVFFGTPDVASRTLEILESHGYVPGLVVTAPDRPVGRHFVMTPPPAKRWAEEHGIPVLQPEKITADTIDDIAMRASAFGARIFIVVAYGTILPERLLTLPQLGTLNIHYSLLPLYRGASPVESAILAGDTVTGVSIQQMVFALDAGPVIAEERIEIGPDETAPQLRGRLITAGGELLASWLPRIEQGDIDPFPQDASRATRCGKIRKEDGLVSLSDDPLELWNKYRAYFGWPGIYYLDERGKRVKITRARLEDGRFIPERIVPEGKKELVLC